MEKQITILTPQKINEILTPETDGPLQVAGVLWGEERRRWSGDTENIRHL